LVFSTSWETLHMNDIPLPAIEFALFMGLVAWLFLRKG
jgi:hypothetical protein